MIMRKLSTGVFIVSCLISSSAAMAESQTVSIGYAQSKLHKFHNIRGVNIQYRYETNTPVGLLASATYLSGSKDRTDTLDADTSQNVDNDIKSYSIQAGPVFRVNSLASLYSTVGVSRTKIKQDYTMTVGQESMSDGISNHTTAFAYGAGVIINPTSKLSVNAGYEGSRATFYGYHAKLNGFNVGVGYRF